MAHTYRETLEHIAETAAEHTLHRAGQVPPTDRQRRAAVRCAMRHTVQHIANTNPRLLEAIRDELAAEHANRTDGALA